MISSWSPASWTSSTRQSTQARLPSITGAPVTGAGCQSTPSNLSPPETAKPRHSVLLVVAQDVHAEAPARAIRGQLVEVRAGATATKGGSMERETKLWQVKPTGSPVLHAGHDGDAGGEPAHGVLEARRCRRSRSAPRPGPPMTPSAAASPRAAGAPAASAGRASSIRSISSSEWAGSWWNRVSRLAPASRATRTA